MDQQPGVADMRAAPGSNRKLRGANQCHEEDYWKEANPKDRNAIEPVVNEEEQPNQKRTKRTGLVEVVQRQMARLDPRFNERNEMEHYPGPESNQRGVKEPGASSKQINERVQQTARIQRSRCPQPNNVHKRGLSLV